MPWIKIISLLGLLGLLLPVHAKPLTAIQERGVLIVGIYPSGFPLAFEDGPGEWRGLEPDLARQLAVDLFGTVQVEFRPLLLTERIKAIETDQVDLVIANLTVTVDRARIIDFSTDYYRTYGSLALKAGDSAQSLGDLNTARIAVLPGSSTLERLKHLLPKAEVVPVANYALAQNALQTGQVRAVAADSIVFAGWMKQGVPLRVLPVPLGGYVVGMGLPKGLPSSDWRDWVNSRIRVWQSTGWLAQIQERWRINAAP